MTKNLFQPGEIKKKDGEFKLGLVHNFYEPVEEVVEEEIPEYTGPSIEDLMREAEEFKANFEIEKQKMLEDAEKEAAQIVEKAKDAAFNEIKKNQDEAQTIKTEAENSANSIIQDAQKKAEEILADAEKQAAEKLSLASEEGFKQGKNEGFSSGEQEVSRLIDRVHKILEGVMAKRQEILNDTEQQIVDLVLLISRKIVKIMSENQKQVVIANVLQALKKIKIKTPVTIRVNMDDVKITTENISNFIHQVEKVEGITVVEDGTVDKGGCIVETDFGSVDARISSQLAELESKILEISPVKNLEKKEPSNKM